MDCFDTTLEYANMQKKKLRNFTFKILKNNSVKFMRTSNSVYNFHMFLCLSTYDTAYKICLMCPLYSDKVS